MKTLLMLLTAATCCIAPATAQFKIHDAVHQGNQRTTYYMQPVYSRHFTDTANTKAFYLQKSKTQRTAGWILLGGGALLAVSGGVLFSNNFQLFNNKNDDKAATGGVLFLTGLGCSLGSIPFFISAAHNANKAATISFNTQPILLPQQNNVVVKTQAAICVKIKL